MASRVAQQSVLEKLARCQRILGYTFRDITLLQQSLTLGKNRRLATAGDTYVQVALVDRWFSHAKTTSADFQLIREETVSNSNLARVGFRRNLDACTFPSPCVLPRDMADTVEAILGAVYRDSLFEDGERRAINWDEFESVVARLGINHRLIASPSDLRWALTPMRTTRKILPQFFSGGNHFELAKMVAGVSGHPYSALMPRSKTGSEPNHLQEVGYAADRDVDSYQTSHHAQLDERVPSDPDTTPLRNTENSTDGRSWDSIEDGKEEAPKRKRSLTRAEQRRLGKESRMSKPAPKPKPKGRKKAKRAKAKAKAQTKSSSKPVAKASRSKQKQ